MSLESARLPSLRDKIVAKAEVERIVEKLEEEPRKGRKITRKIKKSDE